MSEPGVGTSELIPMRPDPNRLDRSFLAWYLRSPYFLDFSSRHTRGANLPRVSMEDLWKHVIPVPPLVEQRRIVARICELLDRVAEVDDLRSQSSSSSALLLPALLREQFDELDSEYPAKSLAEATEESRYGTSEKCGANAKGTPVLRIPNVAEGRCNFDELKFLSRKVAKNDTLLLRQGDLLIVRTNGSRDLVGRCAVVPALERDYAYASYLIRFRLDEKVALPGYASYFLSSADGREQIAQLRRTSAGQFNINSEALRSIVMPLPPIKVQAKMIERMDRINSSVRSLRTRLARETSKTSLLPAAILRKAFAGEL